MLHDAPRGGVDDVVVRVDGSRDEFFSQVGDCVDRDTLAPAGEGVGGEDDTRGRRGHHALHDDGQPDGACCRSHSRRDRRPPARSRAMPSIAYGVQQRVIADDVQIRVLLAGERGARQVFGGGRGTHGYGPAA